jgi:hypothetical protein
MSKKRRLITCIFCGDVDVPGSEEHVIPRWLAKKMAHYCRQALGDDTAKPHYVNLLYDSTGQLLADHEAGTIGQNAKSRKVIGETPVAYKLPEVCVKCNGGWMERLEDTVRTRLLPGLLEGKTKPLDPYDQLVLSMWTLKTCLAYDAAQEVRFIPADVGSRLLYSNGYPLLYSQVLIGHDHNHKMEGEIRHGRDSRHATDTHCPAVSVSFQFGHFICWAVISMPDPAVVADGGPQLLCLGPTDNSKFVQIWPPVPRRLDWPSDAAKAARRPTSGTQETVTEPEARTPEDSQ